MASAGNDNLTYIVQNTVTKNETLYPDKWYLEVDPLTKKKAELPTNNGITVNIEE